MLLARREVSREAELLMLRHENAVLRRQTARVCYQPADRLWLAALSVLIPATDGARCPLSGHSARLAPPPDRPQMGLHQQATSRTAADRSRHPQARDPHPTENPCTASEPDAGLWPAVCPNDGATA